MSTTSKITGGVELVMSLGGFETMAAKSNDKRGKGVHWTADRTVELPIKVSTDPYNPASAQPFTVPQVFQNTVANFPDSPAVRVERNGKWREWTFTQYYQECVQFAKALVAVDFQPHEGVSIIGFNSPEWFFADLGTILAGGIAAGIYTTNGPESCFYIADHSEAKVVVVEDDVQLQKFLKIRHRLPHLKTIVQYMGEPSVKTDGVYSWKDFIALGKNVPNSAIDARMAAQRPGHCCTLIYTSGTTGKPKAVMLSHDNITWTASVASNLIDIKQGDRAVSYLPLSHIAAQMTDLHGPLLCGIGVSFARPDALKGSLVQTLQAVRPTMMLGVPRVWEKIEEKMRAVGAGNTGLKKTIGDWAKGVGLEANYAKLKNDSMPWGYTAASTIVFNNVKKALGLDACRLRVTGAAPISLKTLEYFMSLDMPLHELYGMSESSGPHTMNLPMPGGTAMGSVGKTLPGAETLIANKDTKGHGEICARGRHIFMGYMNNEEATVKTIDANGWLKSGDIGVMDHNGFVSITGRIKELIITAGGENIPPVLIEDAIKAELPAISNIMIIGDQRKFLSALITLKSEPDADGQPSDQPTSACAAFIQTCGSDTKSIAAACQDAKVLTGLKEGIVRANNKAISRATHVQKFRMLASDFTIASGDLTPTMKLKRSVVQKKHIELIETMYSGATKIPSKM